MDAEMDAEMKRMETDDMLDRLTKKKHQKRAVLSAAARAVFKEFVVHAMTGKELPLIKKKAKPAAIELACSFAKWAVDDKDFSLSHACEYIPFLYNAVLDDWPEVIVGVPAKGCLDDLKKGCELLLNEKMASFSCHDKQRWPRQCIVNCMVRCGLLDCTIGRRPKFRRRGMTIFPFQSCLKAQISLESEK
jgi:hypothetical protein